jgi:hypothetical protein
MSTGCNCWSCEDVVCYFDPYCCTVEWDTLCDAAAGDMCTCCWGNYPGYCLPEPGDDGGADVPATTDVGRWLTLLLVAGSSLHFLHRRVVG